MLLLILGLVLVIGTHIVTMRRGLRTDLQEKLGVNGYRVVYSLVSFVGFVALVFGFGLYRATGWIDVWQPPVWTRHLALLLMLPVFVLLATWGRGAIRKVTKHPMLLAVKLWALAHLLANGDLGSMLMFGSFLAWAVMARISIKRRPEEALAAADRATMRFGFNDIIAIIVGLGFYLAFAFWLHPLLIGVPVMTGR
jgi:uncharacterized membrane protein